MRTIGISHKTRYWQHYCFSDPPVGQRYERKLDIPWHMIGVDVITVIFTGNGFYRKGGVDLLKAFSRLNRPKMRSVIISSLEGGGHKSRSCRSGRHAPRGRLHLSPLGNLKAAHEAIS